MAEKDEFGAQPVIVGFPSPFRLVLRDEIDFWSPSLEAINNNTYDYVKLNRVSAVINGNVDYAMLVGFDGSFVLPAIPKFRATQRAVEIFNRVLAEIVLGGTHAEAISPMEIAYGVLLPTGYVRLRPHALGPTIDSYLSIRMGCPGPLDGGKLIEPPTLLSSELVLAIKRGRHILSCAPRLAPSVFLAGITYYIREQWSEALVNVWTSIEQIVGQMWDEKINVKVGPGALIAGRNEFLSDHRTWTSSTRIEILYQKGLIGEEQYAALNVARKARNRFVHDGVSPSGEAVEKAVEAVFYMLSLRLTNYERADELEQVRLDIVARCRGRRFGERPRAQRIEPKYWLDAANVLPGEDGWMGKYEGFEFRFVSIAQVGRS